MESVNSLAAVFGSIGSATALAVSVWTLWKDIKKNRADTTASITDSALKLATFKDKEFDDCRDRLIAAYTTIDGLHEKLGTANKLLRLARAKLRDYGEDTAPFKPIKDKK